MITQADRVPPCDITIEKHVLGIIIGGRMGKGEQALASITDRVKPEDFYTPAHAELYRVLCDMLAAGKPIELAAIAAELRRLDRLEPLGGPEYITNLAENYGFDTLDDGHYTARLVELSRKRSLVLLGADLHREAYEPESTPAEIIEKAQTRLCSLSTGDGADDPLSIAGDTVDDAIRHSEKVAAGEIPPGLATGFDMLDQATGCFQPGDLVVLGVKTSGGKSAFAQRIAINVCRNDGAVFIASAEMPRRSVGFRLLQIVADLDGSRLRRGELTDAEKVRRDQAAAEIQHWRLAIYDQPATISELAVRSRYLVSKWRRPLSLIVVDYLQLMKPHEGDTRAQQIGAIAWACKQWASAAGCPVLLLSQLNRAGVKEASDERPPSLHDLKESGDIENHANVIILLHRPGQSWNTADGRVTIWGKVAKARDGAVTPWPNATGHLPGSITFKFRPESTRFDPGEAC